MSRTPAGFEGADRTADRQAVSPQREVDPEEAALMAALRASLRPAHDCKSGGCDTCPCRFDEGAKAHEEMPAGLVPEGRPEGSGSARHQGAIAAETN